MSSSTSALVTITNKQAEEATRKSKRNGGHANTNLSEKTLELRKHEQALALEQSSVVGGSKQPSKKQKHNEKGGKGSGKGSHKNSQQNITDYHNDYRKKEGTDQERFIKTLAVSLQKPGSLKGLDELSVKVKFRNFGGVSNYVSLTNIVGVHKYLKMDGDVMDTYDKMTTRFGAKLHVLTDGYFADQANRRELVADKDSELIFELKPRVNGKLTVLDLATLTDAKLATITECQGKETGQHADHKRSMPQPEFVVGDNEPVTTQKEAVALLKGGGNEKSELLTDMRLKLAKEFTKDPHAFMEDINSTAIKDTWTGRVGHWKSKNSKIVTTQVVVRFGRPFTREDFL